MARVKKSENNAEDQVPFELAMEKLENIVESLESEELALDEMIRVYEEGMKLNQICQTRLKNAELTIKKLEKQRLEALDLEGDVQAGDS